MLTITLSREIRTAAVAPSVTPTARREKDMPEHSCSIETVQPFYLVVDTSAGMGADGRIDSLNDAIQRLHALATRIPVVDHIWMMSILTVSDSCAIVRPLEHPSEGQSLVELASSGPLDLIGAFTTLRQVLETDCRAPKERGMQCRRPVVMLVAIRGGSGAPGKTLEAWSALTDP